MAPEWVLGGYWTPSHLVFAAIGLLLGVIGASVLLGFRLRHLRHMLAASDAALHGLRTGIAVAESQNGSLVEANQTLAADLAERRSEATALRVRLAELETRLAAESQIAETRLQQVQAAEKQLTEQFENLANRILEEKTQKFTEHNKLTLDTVLEPLRVQLGDFRKRVDEIQVSDVTDRASLRTEMQLLREQTQRINQEAVNLTRALKGDKKAQGTWGELVLEQVLERSGLRKGIEYHVQGGFRDAEQRLLKPDVIVHLPDRRDIVVDSKVSLVAYERYCTVDAESEREQALREHAQSIRRHISDLGKKDYSGIPELRSLDFVLMFMPIEAAFLAAFHYDEALFGEAFDAKIVVVTPTTLLATLRTIDNIWRYERQNENASLIADKATQIYEKLRGALEDLDKLGAQFATAQKTYDGFVAKLYTGRGSLVRQVDSFRDLGVKVSKTFPKTFSLGTDEPEDQN